MSDSSEQKPVAACVPLKTENREIRRGDGTLVVRVTYTPRTGRPIRMYRLKFEVISAEGCSKYVFVYQRSTCGKPMEDGSPRDEFVCVADELDEDEIPTEEQGPDLERGVPYYRASSVELLFRNSDMMYECARSITAELTCPKAVEVRR